ncbi:MAG: type 1 glutamine amidotransferase domain-containing protein [Methanobacteriota archaeon]
MVRVAILAENYYEDLELNYPYYRLKEEGFQVDIVGTRKDVVYHGKHGYPVKSDYATRNVTAEDYDAVVIPGGYAPDHMRRHKATLKFVRDMDRKGKVIAAICHGGWMLASCCNLSDKTVTSFFAIRDDLEHAGASWVDRKVVVDGHIITSRKPEDLTSFTGEIIKKLEK